MEDDFFSFEDAPIEKPNQRALAKTKEETIQQLQDELYAENMKIIRDALHFADFPLGTDPEKATLPEEWVKELGEEGARKRLRIAVYATLKNQEAPILFRTAAQIVTGIARAKSNEKHGHGQGLNVMFVQMGAPPKQVVNAEYIEVKE